MRHKIEFVDSAAAAVKSGGKAIGLEFLFRGLEFSLRAALRRVHCVYP